jgi:plastocyanin
LRRLLVLLALAGAAAAAAAPPASHEHPVPIAAMHFGAPAAGLRAGDTILWINRDIVAHTVTARDHSFDVVIQPRQSARIILRRAGAVAFYCRFHPTMQGVLNVGR